MTVFFDAKKKINRNDNFILLMLPDVTHKPEVIVLVNQDNIELLFKRTVGGIH